MAFENSSISQIGELEDPLPPNNIDPNQYPHGFSNVGLIQHYSVSNFYGKYIHIFIFYDNP